MGSMKNVELLKNDLVKKEIDRHKWFESQKAGRDIGFDKAAEDWLARYSDEWIKKHPLPSKKPARSAKRVGF